MPDYQNNPIDSFRKAIRENKKFVDVEILNLSKPLGEYIAQDRDRKDTTSQVSKFYHLVRIAEGIASSGDIQSAKVKLHVLKAQTFYARARKSISQGFKEFFDISLERILDKPSEIKDFLIFFETVYAYFYYQTEITKNKQGRN